MPLVQHPFHAFPIHLYHESKPAIVANDADTEKAARADGYTEQYIPQEFPAHQNEVVKDANAQRAAEDHGFTYAGAVTDPFPRVVTKIHLGPPEKEVDPAIQKKADADREAEQRSAEAKARAEARAKRSE